ncbi:Ubiquitin-conjugating enzyme E2 J1 [Allomyces javanicus]|nr:Ubiquitin-conjugating enzyme E2 J1 [Allomyces javanicus]
MTQLNHKNSSVRRVLKELAEFEREPSPRYTVTIPEEGNLFELHFTIRGPSDTPYANGLYHGALFLPHDYPFRPPEIMFLTPNGRFEVKKKICLSVSDFHPESWQPAWGIRTVLVGISGFMGVESEGAIGSIKWTDDERARLALASSAWCCSRCNKPNADLLPHPEQDGEVPNAKDAEADSHHLNFAYSPPSASASATSTSAPASPAPSTLSPPPSPPVPSPAPRVSPEPVAPAAAAPTAARETVPPQAEPRGEHLRNVPGQGNVGDEAVRTSRAQSELDVVASPAPPSVSLNVLDRLIFAVVAVMVAIVARRFLF